MAYAASGSILLSLIAAAASIFPDLVELGAGRLVFKKHRGLSHNPLFWGTLFILLWAIMRVVIPPVSSIVENTILVVFYGLCAGVALHLFTDSLSVGGIPLFGRKHRIAFHAYKTFHISEYLVAGAIVVLSSFVAYWL